MSTFSSDLHSRSHNVIIMFEFEKLRIRHLNVTEYYVLHFNVSTLRPVYVMFVVHCGVCIAVLAVTVHCGLCTLQ